MNRRGFLTGLIAAVVAPAVVRADALMPIRGIIMPVEHGLTFEAYTSYFEWTSGVGHDWRYHIEVCNFDDISRLDAPEPPDMFALMAKAVVNAPVGLMQARFAASRAAMSGLTLQAIRDKHVLLAPAEPPVHMGGSFRGIPIELVE